MGQRVDGEVIACFQTTCFQTNFLLTFFDKPSPRLRALPKEGELIPPLSEGHGDGLLMVRFVISGLFIFW